MLLKNKLRAAYTRRVHGNVIADLAADFDLSRYQVIFCDTRGIWDQLLVNPAGRFVGFSSINERDLSVALARVTRH